MHDLVPHTYDRRPRDFGVFPLELPGNAARRLTDGLDQVGQSSRDLPRTRWHAFRARSNMCPTYSRSSFCILDFRFGEHPVADARV